MRLVDNNLIASCFLLAAFKQIPSCSVSENSAQSNRFLLVHFLTASLGHSYVYYHETCTGSGHALSDWALLCFISSFTEDADDPLQIPNSDLPESESENPFP